MNGNGVMVGCGDGGTAVGWGDGGTALRGRVLRGGRDSDHHSVIHGDVTVTGTVTNAESPRSHGLPAHAAFRLQREEVSPRTLPRTVGPTFCASLDRDSASCPHAPPREVAEAIPRRVPCSITTMPSTPRVMPRTPRVSAGLPPNTRLICSSDSSEIHTPKRPVFAISCRHFSRPVSVPGVIAGEFVDSRATAAATGGGGEAKLEEEEEEAEEEEEEKEEEEEEEEDEEKPNE